MTKFETDWNDLRARFEPHLTHKRYGQNARRMLELVDLLRETDDVITASISLFTLSIGIPGLDEFLEVVWHDAEQAYQVYRYAGESIVTTQFVPQDDILEVIGDFVQSNTR